MWLQGQNPQQYRSGRVSEVNPDSPVITVSTSRTPTTKATITGTSQQVSATSRHRARFRVPLLGCAGTDSRRHISG